MIGCAIAALLIAGATLVALRPQSFKQSVRTELFNTDRKQTAEGLSRLPKSYGELSPSIPRLGPPSPGDVGRAFVENEKKAGVASDTGFRTNPEEDAERAERIRQTRIAQQAKESGLFFRLSEKQDRRRQASMTEVAAAAPSAFRPSTTDTGPSAAELAKTAQAMVDRSGEIVPSSQARKLAFVGTKADTETTNPHALKSAPSTYAVMAGSIIPASLVTGLNSDLPGATIGQVTENVFDTLTGEHLLIPQGTRLLGKYDSVVAFGQKRALVVWTRLILPNGNSIVIENLPATDVAGYAGLEDEVDFHTWQLLKGVALATLIGVGTQLSIGNDESDLVKALRESTQQTTNRAGQRLVERKLDVQPTITVRPGWPLRVIVSKDLVLKPYQDVQSVAKSK
ncbi:type IV secretion system protein VirB10 [Bradyrhizobium macuxiense]|uniref:Type IV secretion system protein VirB10 n=1 Tax=Bradyrhizobium macuxiense TaxID=1755647 RepID=A0A560L382_9BRAD|nr:TrbI/VirB10 family protein [Bradyrhizobium macuxiense]TWB89923.1 type IV secretion system protein VirB10 [Bradyrhizobium macuxiense]